MKNEKRKKGEGETEGGQGGEEDARGGVRGERCADGVRKKEKRGCAGRAFFLLFLLSPFPLVVFTEVGPDNTYRRMLASYSTYCLQLLVEGNHRRKRLVADTREEEARLHEGKPSLTTPQADTKLFLDIEVGKVHLDTKPEWQHT